MNAPWLDAAYVPLQTALASQHLAHAWLITGPRYSGKRALADRLAARLLCLTPEGVDACGHCRACQLRQAGTHPDLRLVTREMNTEGTRLRQDIVIEQMRQAATWLGMTAQLGRALVLVVDPADAVNTAAANALLKTLEEPMPGRYLLLLSAQPARLPATIRSRCQRLPLRAPAQADALAWLIAQGIAERDAVEALTLARGEPGLALHLLNEGGVARQRAVADELARLASGELAAPELAQRWAADDALVERLGFAAEVAVTRARTLTDPLQQAKLARWFDACNRTRELLRSTVRADLALAALFLEWQAAFTPVKGSTR